MSSNVDSTKKAKEMQRLDRRGSEEQTEFDFGPMVPSQRESALRAAYVRLRSLQIRTFEQTMSDPAYAIEIWNLADAIARRKSAERIVDT